MKVITFIFQAAFAFSLVVFGFLFATHKFFTLIWYVGGPSDIGHYTIDYYPLTVFLYCVFLCRFIVLPKNKKQFKTGLILSISYMIICILSFNAAGSYGLYSFLTLFLLSYWTKASEVRTAVVKQVLDRLSWIKYPVSIFLCLYTVLSLVSFVDRQQQLLNTTYIHGVVNEYYGQPFANLEATLGPPVERNKPSDLVFFYKPNLTYHTYCQSTVLTKVPNCEGVKVYVDENEKIVAAAGTGPYMHILQETPPTQEKMEEIADKTNVFQWDLWWWRLDYLVWSTHVFAGRIPPPLYDRV